MEENVDIRRKISFKKAMALLRIIIPLKTRHLLKAMSSSFEEIVALATLIISVSSAIIVIFRCIKDYRRHRLPQTSTYTTIQAGFETVCSPKVQIVPHLTILVHSSSVRPTPCNSNGDIVLKTYRWLMSKPVRATERSSLVLHHTVCLVHPDPLFNTSILKITN